MCCQCCSLWVPSASMHFQKSVFISKNEAKWCCPHFLKSFSPFQVVHMKMLGLSRLEPMLYDVIYVQSEQQNNTFSKNSTFETFSNDSLFIIVFNCLSVNDRQKCINIMQFRFTHSFGHCLGDSFKLCIYVGCR